MAENIKFKDSDILKNMEYLNDYESIVYGANGHYANGAFYNLNKNYGNNKDNLEFGLFINKEFFTIQILKDHFDKYVKQ